VDFVFQVESKFIRKAGVNCHFIDQDLAEYVVIPVNCPAGFARGIIMNIPEIAINEAVRFSAKYKIIERYEVKKEVGRAQTQVMQDKNEDLMAEQSSLCFSLPGGHC
jgi:hypothetical protein